MTNWTEMKSSEKPAELFRIAPDLYMQTRNAEEVTETGADGSASTGWVCEARTVTKSELNILNRIEETETQADETNQSLSDQIAEVETHASDIDLALAELAGLIGGE